MIDKDEVILICQNNNADKPGFAQRFRERLVYPFQKKRFYAQWENAPMDMRFRLTNKCNENCSRCFECSGPGNPLNAVPVDDIVFYGNHDHVDANPRAQQPHEVCHHTGLPLRLRPLQVCC